METFRFVVFVLLVLPSIMAMTTPDTATEITSIYQTSLAVQTQDPDTGTSTTSVHRDATSDIVTTGSTDAPERTETTNPSGNTNNPGTTPDAPGSTEATNAPGGTDAPGQTDVTNAPPGKTEATNPPGETDAPGKTEATNPPGETDAPGKTEATNPPGETDAPGKTEATNPPGETDAPGKTEATNPPGETDAPGKTEATNPPGETDAPGKTEATNPPGETDAPGQTTNLPDSTDAAGKTEVTDGPGNTKTPPQTEAPTSNKTITPEPIEPEEVVFTVKTALVNYPDDKILTIGGGALITITATIEIINSSLEYIDIDETKVIVYPGNSEMQELADGIELNFDRFNLTVGESVLFEKLNATLELDDVLCTTFTHVCIRVEPETNARWKISSEGSIDRSCDLISCSGSTRLVVSGLLMALCIFISRLAGEHRA
ncbi:mucin-2-like [Lytechinus variegatus]|uniref:mucin-2-like n=1 Tax=Lytechinus variegatus TaxID=7654 RepID=UPI001BB0E7C5|nr:mucin-2-like [Lytechinus variegatus]